MYAGIVYDVLRLLGVERNFVIDPKIAPLDDGDSIYGKVFTTYGRLTKPDEDYEALDEIRLEMLPHIKNATIVALSANDDLVAHAGDITLEIYSKYGIEGFVTDGLVRDSSIIKHEMEFPCFCNGTSPVDAIDYWAITAYQCPIFFQGRHEQEIVAVHPGDYIYADSDGAMVIPKENLIQFELKVKKEIKREEKIRRQLLTKPLEDILKEHGRW